MTARELIDRIENKDNSDEEWQQIEKDIMSFLKSDAPAEEKKLFVPLGYLEMVSIIVCGIERKKASTNISTNK